MSETAKEITLQVNLSAGDLAYAEQTVRALVASHRREVTEVMAVVDCCRPQSTPWIHSESQFPATEFSLKINRLRQISERLKDEGTLDRVEYLEPDFHELRKLNQKYTGLAISHSHDHLGHAFSAYFKGWETCSTRYILHSDADILFHEEAGYRWPQAAVERLRGDPLLLAVSPRIAPPVPKHQETMIHIGQPGSGWLPTWRLTPAVGGWRSNWFSTRCHLIDRERLGSLLPLQDQKKRGRTICTRWIHAGLSPFYTWKTKTAPTSATSIADLPARLARKIARDYIPPFPLPPEVLLHQYADGKLECFYLDDPRAWFIHPDTKPEIFFELLPEILEGVRNGRVPPKQAGISGVQFDVWHTGEYPEICP